MRESLFLISIICIGLIIYIILLQREVKRMNQQLEKRLIQKTRQPVNLALINQELNHLAANINRCLQEEESLRLESIRSEKKFKELIANISHDLRTPLTAIKGYLQLMEKTEMTEDQLAKLTVARKYSDQLGILIEDFFEYTYIEQSNSTLQKEAFNLTNLVTECLAEAVHGFEEKNREICLKETEPVMILGDKQAVMRIVQNLLKNSLAHADGNIIVRIYKKEEAVMEFENFVSNTAELHAEKIFDRFYTGDQARRNSTGLGLSIVKLLTEQMSGKVYADLNNNILKITIKLPIYTV